MNSRNTFFISLVGLGLLLLALDYLLVVTGLQPALSGYTYASHGYFFLITALVHRMLVRAGKGDPKRFVTVFMGVMGMKLFASLVFLLIVLLLKGVADLNLGVHFMVLYLAYTSLEVVALLRTLKRSES